MEYSKEDLMEAKIGSGREHGNRGKQKDLGEKRTILG
jgi:hypothetical protein